ncbi:hypothetical protein [Dactylosporangium sp. NPDC005555]|uniref:hypothetical protein n=1 Tax=Dactylosporangium sp. NPDC005555 TaxID=3154889 RepID=UPI0033B2A775
MSRWLRLFAPAGLALTAAVLPAGPASAAPCGSNCVRYQADITIAGWTAPITVIPGGTHTITLRVTNTGWRTGSPTTPPMPGIGPASGPVWVTVRPSSVDERPLADYHDGGPAFPCQAASGNGLYCGTDTIPSGETGQFTIVYRAPTVPGTYTFSIYADSYRWTEYDENNNRLTLTYQVG